MPLSLSYYPKRDGHPFKVKGITDDADAKMLFHRKMVSHLNIFFFNMSYFNILL